MSILLMINIEKQLFLAKDKINIYLPSLNERLHIYEFGINGTYISWNIYENISTSFNKPILLNDKTYDCKNRNSEETVEFLTVVLEYLQHLNA